MRWAVLLLPFTVGIAHAEEVKISRDDCRYLSAYTEGGADYVPGVTADGGSVAPADLSPPPEIVGPEILITLEVDLMEEYGIGPASPLLDSDVQLGVITVEGDAVHFNGRPLGNAETRYLSRACLEKQREEAE